MTWFEQLSALRCCRIPAGIALSLVGFSALAQDVLAETSPWRRDTLTGDWGGWRSRLTDKGVDFSPTYTGEVMGDVSGGLVGPGTVYDHCVNLPLTVEPEKLAGWQAAMFHVNALWIEGDSLSTKHVGDIANVSNISAERAVRLQELWLQQGFFGQLIEVKAGLVAADNIFFGSDAAALFVNGAFGAFPLVGANLPNPPTYPMAAPALCVRVQATTRLYFQAASFDGNSGSQSGNASGTDMRIATDDGALMLSEIGWLPSSDTGTNSLATTLKAGGFLLTKRQPTWKSQTDGATGGGRMNWGIYGVAEQDLFRRGERIITLFLRGGYAPADRNVVDWYVDTGVNLTGFVPGRPEDVLGAAFSRSNLSHDYDRHEQMISGSTALNAESIVEVTYRASLTPWWTLQPDFQYIVTPGGADDCDNAVVIGLRTTVSF